MQAVLRPTGLHRNVPFVYEGPPDLVQRQPVDVPAVDLQQPITRFEGDAPPSEEPVVLNADDPHFAVPLADLDADVFAVPRLGDLPPQSVAWMDHNIRMALLLLMLVLMMILLLVHTDAVLLQMAFVEISAPFFMRSSDTSLVLPKQWRFRRQHNIRLLCIIMHTRSWEDFN